MAQARPDRSSESDGELVRMILAGEADSFAELVRRTQRSGYRLARRITRNHEDADDVLQESYAKAYRALDRFAPDRPFGPWFLTIVARTALSWIRDQKRRSAVPLDEPGMDGSAPLADKLADPAFDPVAVERRSRVERAFTKLSEDHRMVLAMRVEGDLSYAAIAEALSIPVGTVMSRLARAREALVEILNEMKEAEPK
jgi:RNA polymerase sigma factor (sigma-70 family)